MVALFFLIALWLVVAAPRAIAEDGTRENLERAGFDGLVAAASDMGVSNLGEVARRVLAGEMLVDEDLIRRGLRRAAGAVRDGLTDALKCVAAPVLATALVRLLLGRRDEALALLCRLASAAALAVPFAGVLKQAADMMSRSARVTDAVAPVLAAALALGGESAAAAMLAPLSALFTDVSTALLSGAGIGLCAVAATVNIAGCLSPQYRLDRLFSLIMRLTVLGIGVLMALATALLMVEGRVALAQDVASVRAVRLTIKSAIPFVGSSIADSAGAILQSAALARSAVGVAGMALAVCVNAWPMARLFVVMLSLKLASAAIEPVADRGIVRVTGGFGDVAGMLLAICAAGATLNVLLCGMCLGAVGV